MGALHSLHESIEICLKLLAQKEYCGHACGTNSGTSIFLHFALTSYVADIPETEDLLGIKRGGQTKYSCHECMKMIEKLHMSTHFLKRNAQKTQELMKSASQKSLTAKELEQYFAEESMLPLSPVLPNVLFAGAYLTVDIYSIFRYEPMHSLSLGVGRMLNEYIVYSLGDDRRLSSAMRRQNGNMRLFKSIKHTVLLTLNAFLERCFNRAPGHGLMVDFSKTENSGRLTGLFNENGLHEMLKASDFDAIDNVSPVLDGFVDALCSLCRSAKVTSAMTEYVDMVNFMFRRHMNFERI